MIPADAFNPTWEDTVIALLLMGIFNNCFDITKLELDVSIIDTFFFGSRAYKPPLVRFVILGDLILNVEFVEIPAARISLLLIPVTAVPTGESVKVWPFGDISLTRLNTGSANVPWL